MGSSPWYHFLSHLSFPDVFEKMSGIVSMWFLKAVIFRTPRSRFQNPLQFSIYLCLHTVFCLEELLSLRVQSSIEDTMPGCVLHVSRHMGGEETRNMQFYLSYCLAIIAVQIYCLIVVCKKYG